MDVMKLRWLSCNYVQEHRDDFIPYLFDEETMKMKDIDEYTKEMEHTAQWGGEIEILALSHVFDCPISILMSGRPIHRVITSCLRNNPPVVEFINESFPNFKSKIMAALSNLNDSNHRSSNILIKRYLSILNELPVTSEDLPKD